jgi:hypothetical protein
MYTTEEVIKRADSSLASTTIKGVNRKTEITPVDSSILLLSIK